MTEIVEERRVARPTTEVWKVLAAFGDIRIWADNVDHSCLLSHQTEGIGTVRRIQAGRVTLVETVVECVPGERLAYEIEGLPPVVGRITNCWELAGDDGTSTVRLVTTIDSGPRPPQRVASRAAARAMAKVSRQLLDGLVSSLEFETPEESRAR